MILDTRKWLEENEKNMTEEERHEADLFMMFGTREHFFYGNCSCCGQYADLMLEDAECIEETDMVHVTYTCLPCWIKHREPLTDEEFEKVKEEIPENDKESIADDGNNNKFSVVDDDDFFNKLCNE